MSQNESEASDKVSVERQSGSVYDFLYCDERRIGTFLSQFDELGVPTRVSVSESVQKARGRAFKFSAGGGVAGVGNANLTVERGPAVVSGAKTEQRDYDPFWANALALLDYLETNELLRRDLGSVRIGQLVLVTGSLTIMDLTLFKGLWSLPAIRSAILAGSTTQDQSATSAPRNRQERRANQQRTEQKPVKGNSEALIDGGLALIGMLPHAIQARLATPDTNIVWSSLREDALVVSSADLILKHGAAIAGEWAMLGICDAFPDADASGQLTESGIAGAMSTLSLRDSPFGQLMYDVMPSLRPMLGRPFSAYGMTPLLIFREISG